MVISMQRRKAVPRIFLAVASTIGIIGLIDGGLFATPTVGGIYGILILMYNNEILEGISDYITEKEKRLVAYHEAGHAVVGIKLEGANEVQKITIIPRGSAGGYNLMLPKEDRMLATKNELLDKIKA